MQEPDKDWWVNHTGEYILGLLDESDQLVLERVMEHEPDVETMVHEWRAHFQPLADALTPVEPPAHVLNNLLKDLPPQTRNNQKTKRIVGGEASVAGISAEGNTSVMQLLRDNHAKTDRWRAFSGLCVAGILLATMFGFHKLSNTEQQATAEFDAVSIVQNNSAQALWVVAASSATGDVRVTTISPPELTDNKSYALWMVKPDEFEVDGLSADGTTFGVSVEPVGASEPAPSGPMLYRGEIQALKF